MTEPTTPTGKRLMMLQPFPLSHGSHRPASPADIIAIEREAAAAERERLRAKARRQGGDCGRWFLEGVDLARHDCEARPDDE